MNSKASPSISVIVPSLDGTRGGNVEKLRKQIARQTIPVLEFLVIVGVRPNGRARNVGARQAKGDYLLFIDDDVELGSDDVVERMVTAFQEDERIALVGVSQQVPETAGAFARHCARQLERYEAPVLEQVEDSDFTSHACMMIPRSVYFQVGGEHDLLPRGTDPDLRFRLRQAGYRVVLAPRAWAYHPPPEDWKQLWRIYFRNGAGSVFVHRHFPEYCIDTAPGHGDYAVGKRNLPQRVTGYFQRFVRKLFPPRLIPLVALLAYGCGGFSGYALDKQQWSMTFRRFYKYFLLPPGWLWFYYQKIMGRFSKGTVRILLYHRVENIRRYPLVIPVETFRRQMEYLKKHQSCVSLDEAIDGMRPSGKNEANDCFVITFDDGYRDNYTQAFPILRSLDLPATIYLVTDFIGKETEFPWVRKLGSPTYQILDWEQVYEMAEAGIQFGIHTASHPSLANLSREEQRAEILKSKVTLEEKLGREAVHFCYPYGSRADFNEDTLSVLKELQFHSATTAVAGCNPPDSHPYLLRRTAIDPSDDFFLFRCHLKGYLDLLAWKDAGWIGRLKRFLRERLQI